MMLKNKFIILLPVILFACSAQKIVESKKPHTAMVADGTDTEWNGLLTHDRASRFIYAVSNDEKYLFLCLKVQDEQLEKKIMRHGLTVWIDTTGKNKEKIAVKFPIGVNERQAGGKVSIDEGKKTDKGEARAGFINKSSEMEIKGFPALKDYGNDFLRTEAKSRTGINAAISFDTLGTLVYELQIPLPLIYGSSASGRIAGLIFRTGSMKREEEREEFKVRPEERTQGGMNGNGMGARGTPMNYDHKTMQHVMYMSEPTELRVKVKLN